MLESRDCVNRNPTAESGYTPGWALKCFCVQMGPRELELRPAPDGAGTWGNEREWMMCRKDFASLRSLFGVLSGRSSRPDF